MDCCYCDIYLKLTGEHNKMNSLFFAITIFVTIFVLIFNVIFKLFETKKNRKEYVVELKSDFPNIKLYHKIYLQKLLKFINSNLGENFSANALVFNTGIAFLYMPIFMFLSFILGGDVSIDHIATYANFLSLEKRIILISIVLFCLAIVGVLLHTKYFNKIDLFSERLFSWFFPESLVKVCSIIFRMFLPFVVSLIFNSLLFKFYFVFIEYSMTFYVILVSLFSPSMGVLLVLIHTSLYVLAAGSFLYQGIMAVIIAVGIIAVYQNSVKFIYIIPLACCFGMVISGLLNVNGTPIPEVTLAAVLPFAGIAFNKRRTVFLCGLGFLSTQIFVAVLSSSVFFRTSNEALANPFYPMGIYGFCRDLFSFVLFVGVYLAGMLLYRYHLKKDYFKFYFIIFLVSIIYIIKNTIFAIFEINDYWVDQGFLILILIVPLLNGFMDYISLGFSRLLACKILDEKRFYFIVCYLIIDVAVAIFLLLGFVFTLSFFIEFVNVFPFPASNLISWTRFVDLVKNTPFSADGIWVTMMILSTLVPTFCHFVIAFLGFFTVYFMPKVFRNWMVEILNETSRRKHSIPVFYFAIRWPAAFLGAIGLLWTGFLVMGFNLSYFIDLLIRTFSLGTGLSQIIAENIFRN